MAICACKAKQVWVFIFHMHLLLLTQSILPNFQVKHIILHKFLVEVLPWQPNSMCISLTLNQVWVLRIGFCLNTILIIMYYKINVILQINPSVWFSHFTIMSFTRLQQPYRKVKHNLWTLKPFKKWHYITWIMDGIDMAE